MNDTNNDLHVAMRDAIERFLASEYLFESRRLRTQRETVDRTMWQLFADLGLFDADIITGDGLPLIGVVLESFGRHLVLEPYLESVVVALHFLRADKSGQTTELQKRVENGSALVATSGLGMHGVALPVTANCDGHGVRLSGCEPLLMSALDADAFVVIADDGGQPGVFLVQRNTAGLRRDRRALLDGTTAADVTFTDVHAERLYEGQVARNVIAQARLLRDLGLVAEMHGMSQAALDITAEYCRVRVQFGAPLSSFQSVRHQLAAMVVECQVIESMRQLALESAETLSDSTPRSLMAARIGAAQACRKVCSTAIQLHGGMGLADECAIGHYLKRLVVLEARHGSSQELLAEYAAGA